MRFKKKGQQGITLLEVILVLVVGAGILYLSVSQYQNFRRQTDLQQVQNTVDTLFAALYKYFQAHCADQSGGVGGSLGRFSVAQTLGINVNTLINEGFISASDIRLNPFVLTGGVAPYGYVVQFNQKQQSAPSGYSFALPLRQQTLQPSVGGGQKPVGYMVVWQAQVAAQLNTANATADGLMLSLHADCLSSSSTSWGQNIVLSCDNAAGNNFAVWQRSPSFGTESGASGMWGKRANTILFLQQYTTNPILNLTDPSQIGQVNNQYYVCGS